MKQNYEKGILIVLCANLINMFISLVTNFILPRYLSIEAYATIKTFQLYVSYIGLFHLGYSDGLYLRYGGKSIKELDKNTINLSISTMLYFQIFVAIVVAIYAILNRNIILIIFSLDIIGFNLIGVFKNIYQAIGEFKRYANITQVVAVINFIINIAFIFIVKTDNAIYYILGYTIVDIVVFLYLEYDLKNTLKIGKLQLRFSLTELITNIKDGILLLFGNLTSIILMSMDRWFTKIYMYAVDFAHYSFAVSVENLLNVAITPVSITLYNYLCNNQEKDKIRKIQTAIIIFSSLIVFFAFPVKFIVCKFINKYEGAMIVIVILFATQFFSIVIQSIYVNLYKAQKRQKKYFMEVVFVIIIGFILNESFFHVYKYKESFAFGTLVSNFIWFILCQLDFKDLRLNSKEILYLFMELIAFLYFSLYMTTLIGAICYVFVTLILYFTLLRKETDWIIRRVIRFIKNYRI